MNITTNNFDYSSQKLHSALTDQYVILEEVNSSNVEGQRFKDELLDLTTRWNDIAAILRERQDKLSQSKSKSRLPFIFRYRIALTI